MKTETASVQSLFKHLYRNTASERLTKKSYLSGEPLQAPKLVDETAPIDLSALSDASRHLEFQDKLSV